jgi:hypothetical protein
MDGRNGLLFVKLDPPEGKEAEWNNWYNQHCEARLAIPGFLSARRLTKIEGIPRGTCVPGDAQHLALYDLENLSVLQTEAYMELRKSELAHPRDAFDREIFALPKFARGAYQQIYPEKAAYRTPPSDFVFVVGHELPAPMEKEFNAWYNTEHLPALLAVPGFLTARRFVLSEQDVPPLVAKGGSLPKYLTLYDLQNEQAFDTEAFAKASMSPWTVWVRSWYTRKMCVLYRRIYP